MKPLSPNSRQHRSHLKHPHLDAQYHAPDAGFRAAGDRLKLATPLPSPSFRALSNEFFGGEMKREYAAEAVLFTIIVAVAAWPMASLIQAAATLVK
jgi:hypothetical protein